MVTISKSHEISEASRIILEKLLPLRHFVIRPLNPDYHVDYFIELVENKSPSGINFGIQLKGVEKLNCKKNIIKLSLKTKHLRYYLEKVKSFPVYLVIVDITDEKAYWLFMQKYLNEGILNKHWRAQKTVTINMNIKNVINDLDNFKRTVIEANDYINELWPSSIRASARKETEYFKSLDPRFKDISINIKDENVNYNFHSDESFDIKFKVKDGNKLQEYLNNPKDEKFVLKSDEVDVIGSDLMKELLKKSDEIEFKLKYPEFGVEVFMQIMDDEKSFSEILHFNGNLIHKNKIIIINCTQKKSPLTVQVALKSDGSKNPTINLNFDFTHWINKNVQFLPFYDKLNRYFSKLEESKDVIIKIESLGKELIQVKLKMYDNMSFLDYVRKIFSFIDKLKVVNEYYQLSLMCPDFSKINKDDVIDVDELYNLATKGEHLEVNRKMTGSFHVRKEKKILDLYSKGMDIRLVSDGRYTLFGKEINIGEYAIDISSPKLLINNLEMEELLKSRKKYIPLKFTTDEKSKVFVRMLSGNKI